MESTSIELRPRGLVRVSSVVVSEALQKHEKGMFERIAKWAIKYGTENAQDEINRRMNEWKSYKIKIAVFGESGSGKSSFINTFRGLKATDDGAAKVGAIRDTTTKITKYQHPDYSNLKLYDMPGVGTQQFPKDSYLRKINVDKYDFFILTSCTRFMENDYWLAKEVIKREKRFYVLRTRFDEDLKNSKKDGNTHDPDKLIAEIRQYYIEELKTIANCDPVVFVISNDHPFKFEFGDLQKRLVDDSPEIKRDAIILSLSAISKQMLNEKLEVLKSRLTGRAILAVLGALIPIPGVGAAVNYAIMKNEMEFYKEQLGIDDRSLQQLADQHKISFEDFKRSLSLKSCSISESGTEFRKFCVEAHDQLVVDAIAKVVLPVIGGIISAFKSYPAAFAIQGKLLDLCYQEACEVFNCHSEWLTKKD